MKDAFQRSQGGRGNSSSPLWNSVNAKRTDEGKEKVEGSGAGTSTDQFLRDHWGSGLGSDSQHINLDPEAKREIGFL